MRLFYVILKCNYIRIGFKKVFSNFASITIKNDVFFILFDVLV